MRSFVVAFKIVIPDKGSLRDSEGSNFVSRPLVLLAAGNQVSECRAIVEDAQLHLVKNPTCRMFEGNDGAFAMIDCLRVDSTAGVFFVDYDALCLLEDRA